MYKMKRILKRAIACLLAVLMLAGEAPMQKVLAAEVESQTEQQENVTKETEQQTAVQQAETEQEQQDKTDVQLDTEQPEEANDVQLDTEQPEDANDVQLDTEQPEDANDVQLGTGQPEETTGIQVEVPLLNYVYVDKNRVEIGDTQNIALSVGDDTTVIESAKLYVQNKDGEQYTLEASEIEGNAILFAENYQDYLRKYIELKNGIPSHDTIRRVMGMISPEILQQLYGKWQDRLNQDKTTFLFQK